MNRESEVGFVAQFSELLFAVLSGIEEGFSTSRVDLKMSGFIFPKKVSSFRMAKSLHILTNSFAEVGFMAECLALFTMSWKWSRIASERCLSSSMNVPFLSRGCRVCFRKRGHFARGTGSVALGAQGGGRCDWWRWWWLWSVSSLGERRRVVFLTRNRWCRWHCTCYASHLVGTLRRKIFSRSWLFVI